MVRKKSKAQYTRQSPYKYANIVIVVMNPLKKKKLKSKFETTTQH